LANSVALGRPRRVVIFAITVNFPLAGSYRRVRRAVANPSSGDQNFARTQQHRNLSDAADAHLSCALKLARRRIIKLRRLIEILVAPHAAGDENPAVGKKRSRVA
jgi:hypothetical protein